MSSKQHNNYRRIQLLVGSLGMLLPFILPLFQKMMVEIKESTHPYLLPSISHYNYSYAQIIFVGTLVSFGLLLISYKGYKDDPQPVKDDHITMAAGIFALIVALIPTEFDARALVRTPNVHISSGLGTIHLIAAGLFLFGLGWMCIAKFSRSPKTDKYHTRRKRVYKICGWIVISSIVILLGMFLYKKIIDPEFDLGYAVFIFETTSLFGFGFAWLLKGKARFFVQLRLISSQELADARTSISSHE